MARCCSVTMESWFPFYFSNLFLIHYSPSCTSASHITIDAFSKYIYFYSKFNRYVLQLVMVFSNSSSKGCYYEHESWCLGISKLPSHSKGKTKDYSSCDLLVWIILQYRIYLKIICSLCDGSASNPSLQEAETRVGLQIQYLLFLLCKS